MPELPEVETVKNVIEPLIKGKTIASVEVYNKNTIVTDLATFAADLQGKSFESMSRNGKFLVFHLSGGKVLVSHLRMEGKYFVFEDNHKRGAHDMVKYLFTDGTTMFYNDVRKFGIIGLYDEADYMKTSDIAKLGKEPFTITKEELFEGLQRKKCSIKEGLLDQTLIAGLGNIYVDEVCFATSIHPRTSANLISLKECQAIIENAVRILNEAIKEGGSTIKSFHPTKGVDGRMQNRLMAYGHDGEPCPKCGHPFRKIVVGGRGTTYCPHCQVRRDMPFTVVVTGPIHSGKSTVSKILEDKGYVRIDADQIVHDLYESDKVIKKIETIVGSPLRGDSGLLDRKKLAGILSTDKKRKLEVQEYVHPLVAKEAKRQIASFGPKAKIVFEVPLLVGSGCEDLSDCTILVLSAEEERRKRLEAEGRDGNTLVALNEGYRLSETKRISDLIIENDGSIKELKAKLKDF